MAITKLIQGWFAAIGISIETIGMLGLIELPYTLKLLWAPMIDHWAIPWPDRRRGWIALLQVLLGLTLFAFGRLAPSQENPNDLLLVCITALITAFLSASQDIVIDAYRTDLLPNSERGIGAAGTNLGYRIAMLCIGSGGFFIAGRFGWSNAFLFAGLLMLCTAPITIFAPKLRQLKNPIKNLKEAIISPTQEFLSRTGKVRAIQIIILILLYRWPDGLLDRMATPFLVQAGFKLEVIGTIQGGWGIGATIIGSAIGGILFTKIGLNKSLWIYGVFGSISNLAYWALAVYGGGIKGLLIAVSVENFCGGMMVSAFLALLMSLCNPRFSATQYALFSSIFALGRSLLSSPGGFVVAKIGWSSFFALSIATAIPSLLIMTIVVPWKASIPKGAFDPQQE